MRAYKSVIIPMVLVFVLSLTGGCLKQGTLGIQEAGNEAERLLSRVIHAVEEERRPYTSQSEVVVGEMVLPKVQKLNTNGVGETAAEGIDPYESLLFLKDAKKTVELERDQGTGSRVLVVRPNTDDWTTLIKSDWNKRIKALQTQGEALIEQHTSRFSGIEARKLHEELASSLEIARSKMEHMVETMWAEGTIKITLQNNNRLPKQLVIETKQQYEGEEGGQQEETIRSIYDFDTNTVR